MLNVERIYFNGIFRPPCGIKRKTDDNRQRFDNRADESPKVSPNSKLVKSAGKIYHRRSSLRDNLRLNIKKKIQSHRIPSRLSSASISLYV